ncbi:MAG TPA: DNA/RNA nuclease SfsA [Rhodocyclaceae bacterium]|nr:DNA/RNA nuclease SfsA [Rhodocyclaceae bacterium]HNH34640.1 DNA/RNA nuclease SfsA [Rhodocyclaceae bacterium]
MILPTLAEGRLVRRRNRFVAEVAFDGEVVEAHCPNTGSMLGCREPGSRVWLSPAANPARKLAWTWEIVEADGTLVGINTGRSNHLVREAIEAGRVPPLAGYQRIRPEVRYGEGSRIDLLLEAGGRPPCWVEVKNVTAAVADGIGHFPDAVTERGAKHLREMSVRVAAGDRAMLVFCVQRSDVAEVRPADHIDPAYGRALRTALASGVEAIALGAEVSPAAISLVRQLPVVAP